MAVNGVAQHGTCELDDGDTFNLGNLVLRYTGAVDADQPPGDRGTRYTAGRDMYAAGRDIHHNVRTNNNYGSPEDVKGPGLPFIILGGMCCLAGIGWFMVILFSAPNSPNSSSSSLSQIPLTFGVFGVGAVLALIGNIVSRVAREKAGDED
jgi:hypothetical protein